MGTGPGGQPPLKVDPELLGKYGNQLLTAAGDLPDAPAPFTVAGADAISQAIAQKLPSLEGAIQEALPQLKNEASTTASNVVEAAGRYSTTDAQLAAEYEKHQFDSAGSAGGGLASGASALGGGGDSMGQLGQMMSMPMQMASQATQMPAQAMSAVGQVPQGIMQGVEQIGQMGGAGGGQDARDEAAAGDADSERAPTEPPAATAAPDRTVDL
ncbi:hypothetical protein TUM20983_00830 [Mycobacterium antarcticum]|uniref:hypothetical protein n=1 Tax=Mycolicibacterium sp. TUM20983 TaxID=3023369 RepID=UPI0023894D01|nr:hypothetical protein [Mycolicibacterium sp. TUM20983]GLP72973.1 hypothetical protein TUM20983_00830 [Mycolicibacterium sp. TUM20983]